MEKEPNFVRYQAKFARTSRTRGALLRYIYTSKQENAYFLRLLYCRNLNVQKNPSYRPFSVTSRLCNSCMTTVRVVNFPVSRNRGKPNFIHNLFSFEGEIHDYNEEINFAHLNLWVCMSFSCVTWAGFS